MTVYHAIIKPKSGVEPDLDDVAIIRIDMVFEIGPLSLGEDRKPSNPDQIIRWCLRQLHITDHVEFEVHEFSEETGERQEGVPI